jgi:phage terminase small subunit
MRPSRNKKMTKKTKKKIPTIDPTLGEWLEQQAAEMWQPSEPSLMEQTLRASESD